MKILGIILFLSTAAAAQQDGGNAADVPRALAPAMIHAAFPQASSLAATQAPAPQVFKHVEAGVQFEVPAGWTVEPAGDVLTITAPDSVVSVVVWALDESVAGDELKSLTSELDKTIKNRKMAGPARKATLNGMPVVSESGTGEVDGTIIEWRVDLITAKRPVICLFFLAPKLADKHADEIAKFRSSIKKLI
jgi:predicted Zn-dependent protease